MQNALTTEMFWDDYWAGIRLPALVDPNIQWQYALGWALKDVLPVNPSWQLFEVGCAPGRWLVWFGREFGYQVGGCDTSPKGVLLTRENLRINELDGEIYELDLMKGTFPKKYDVVVSLGVIEHFADSVPIVRRHVELLKPGGMLVLEVPNMAGRINNFLLSAAGMGELVRLHNLSVMTRSYLRHLAAEFGLNLAMLAYIGGFDPGIVVFNHDAQRHGQRAVLFPLRALTRVITRFPGFGQLLTKCNHPAWSHMLIGVFQRTR